MRTFAVWFALAGTVAFAQGTEAPAEDAAPKGAEVTGADADAAKDLVTKYLTAVKAKKWAKAIAERKKRMGKEDHPMAPQAAEKTEFYLQDFKVAGVTAGPGGTFVVETSEDNFQVAEKGVANGEMATYLVGKKDGKWWIADKKRGETFNKDSVKLGYKGYFDKVETRSP
jgi:hypothetical protein